MNDQTFATTGTSNQFNGSIEADTKRRCCGPSTNNICVEVLNVQCPRGTAECDVAGALCGDIITPPQSINQATVGIQINILPGQTPIGEKKVEYKFNVNTLPIPINISEPIIATANEFLDEIISIYVDEERSLKTLLNYGDDKQSVVLAQRGGPVDENGIQTIQLKLLQPVPDDISANDSVFLSREVAKTVIDKTRIRFASPIDTTPYLRPRNLKAKTNIDSGRFLTNTTLETLKLKSGSVGSTDALQNRNFEDKVFRQWYSYDFNSSELNIDFTNYENFVFYSSAAMRLAAFREKLRQIEKLESTRKQILTSYTANTASAGIVYLKQKSEEYSLQKEDIIRSFDRYEQYLFFTSGSTSAYSASFDYVDDGIEYNPVGYWPKSGSGLYPIASDVAVSWYTTQSAIAQRFDEFNENNLINTIPSYLREDDDSSAYFTFVSMIGQLFDNIKIYVDQFPNVYSRNLDPNKEISKDLVNEIAESMGFIMPTVDSIYTLMSSIFGENDSVSRRDLAAETYKRLLHNLPFFAKAKGTKTALDAFLRTFGITPQLLAVKEMGTPTENSYQIFDEYSTGLYFQEAQTSYITLPISASLRSPKILQLNCSLVKNKTMTILTGDQKWGLNVKRHPTIETLGRFEIASGSSNVVIASSSYYSIFDDKLLNIAIKDNLSTSSFYFTQVDDGDVLFNEIITDTSKFPALWAKTDYVYLGGSGSRVISRYDGVLDEVRLWGTVLSDEMILRTAFDPGSNAGDEYDDPSNYLYAQLSFNNLDTSSLSVTTGTIKNESSYKNISVVPSLKNLSTYAVTGSDFVRYNRTIKQYSPLVGSSTFVTSKVVVEPDPQFIEDAEGLRLYRNRTINQPEQKKFNRGRNTVVVGVSPADIVNQNVIRNFGLENINAAIGSPTPLYKKFDKSLTIFKKHYEQYYYVDVNVNKFIRIMSDLSSVLNLIMDYFIPSRASLLKGVIIEQNVLEQPRISALRDIRFYGKNARRTIDAAGSLTSSAPDYSATFNLSKEITQPKPETLGSYPSYTTQTETEPITEAFGTYAKFDGLIEGNPTDVLGSNITYKLQHEIKNYSNSQKEQVLDTEIRNLNKITYNSKNYGSPGAEPYNRVYSRKLFPQEIQSPRIGGTASIYTPAFYEIPPSADFKDIGVCTYFSNNYGIYYFNELKKIPAYTEPLNATWNLNNQTFGNTATTWSYGVAYEKNDVVYQDVQTENISGNKKYYVYRSQTANSRSYSLPSEDGENWNLLNFTFTEVRIPKRVVFDTFSIDNSRLNNYKVTVLPTTTITDYPSRYVNNFEIGSIAKNSSTQGSIILQSISTIFAMQSTASNIRVRFYRTKEARNADLNRSLLTKPAGSHGVLLDAVMQGTNQAEFVNPMMTFLDGKTSPFGEIFYTINNLDASDKNIVTLSIYYFGIEVYPDVPRKYLRKHYRYFRDNSTAIKRRNYLGCKNTQETTIDGRPVVQIFVGEGNEILVATRRSGRGLPPPSTSTPTGAPSVGTTEGGGEIVTGGGGILDVT